MIKLFFSGLMLVLFATSCYYDNAEELNQNFPQDCNVNNVTYSVDVSGIMSAYCIGCHSGAAPQGQLDLTTYNNVMSAAKSTRDRINRPAGSSGVMPQGGKLSDCDIKTINAWIDAGAPNN